MKRFPQAPPSNSQLIHPFARLFISPFTHASFRSLMSPSVHSFIQHSSLGFFSNIHLLIYSPGLSNIHSSLSHSFITSFCPFVRLHCWSFYKMNQCQFDLRFHFFTHLYVPKFPIHWLLFSYNFFYRRPSIHQYVSFIPQSAEEKLFFLIHDLLRLFRRFFCSSSYLKICLPQKL